MQAETKFKQRVQRDLKTLPHCWFVKTQQVAIRGTPDLLLCVRGKFIALELKRSRCAHIDPLQSHTLSAIANAFGYALIAYPENWSDVFRELGRLAHSG